MNEPANEALEPLLTITEVSEYIRTPVKTLYNWRSAGIGPRAMKFGGGLRYRRSDLETWLRDQYGEAS